MTPAIRIATTDAPTSAAASRVSTQRYSVPGITQLELRVLRLARVLVVRDALVAEVLVADERPVRELPARVEVERLVALVRVARPSRPGPPPGGGAPTGRSSRRRRARRRSSSPATMSAGSARPITAPTTTDSAEQEDRPRREQAARGRRSRRTTGVRSWLGVLAAKNRSIATPATNEATTTTTAIGRTRERYQRQRDGRQRPREPGRAALELAADDRHAEEQADHGGHDQRRRSQERAERLLRAPVLVEGDSTGGRGLVQLREALRSRA